MDEFTVGLLRWKMSKVSSKLIVLAQREFSQGCLVHWLDAHCPEFGIVMAADLAEIHSRGAIAALAGILIYSSIGSQSFGWLEEQTAVRNHCYKKIPMILIADGLDPDLVQNLVSRGAIDAVIPTSDTTKIAAAALRLVLAGGHYVPLLQPSTPAATKGHPSLINYDLVVTLQSVLTARELSVLELLKTGKPNKVIAHSLGMSLSTAKLHVHNIIRKLKVRNRTEAVVSAGNFIISQDHSTKPPTNVEVLDLELPASQSNIEFTPNLTPEQKLGSVRI